MLEYFINTLTEQYNYVLPEMRNWVQVHARLLYHQSILPLPLAKMTATDIKTELFKVFFVFVIKEGTNVEACCMSKISFFSKFYSGCLLEAPIWGENDPRNNRYLDQNCGMDIY